MAGTFPGTFLHCTKHFVLSFSHLSLTFGSLFPPSSLFDSFSLSFSPYFSLTGPFIFLLYSMFLSSRVIFLAKPYQ